MSETIKSYCPACGSNDTVFVGAGGYLTCSWVECPEPDFMEAWKVEIGKSKQTASDIYKRELNYWKDLAERLMQRDSFNMEPKMVIQANPKSQIFIDNPAQPQTDKDTKESAS